MTRPAPVGAPLRVPHGFSAVALQPAIGPAAA